MQLYNVLATLSSECPQTFECTLYEHILKGSGIVYCNASSRRLYTVKDTAIMNF